MSKAKQYKIKLLGKPYMLIYRPVIGMEDIASGAFNAADMEIEIDPRYNLAYQKESLVHEIIECINAQCELELPHMKIQILGMGISQALNDNEIIRQKLLGDRG